MKCGIDFRKDDDETQEVVQLFHLAVFGLLWAFPARAQWQSIGDLSSYSSERNGVTLKSGAVIPTQQVLQYSNQAPIDPLTVTIFLANKARYEFYEDDGHSFDYEQGVYAKRTIQLKRKGRILTRRAFQAFRPGSNAFRMTQRFLIFAYAALGITPRS